MVKVIELTRDSPKLSTVDKPDHIFLDFQLDRSYFSHAGGTFAMYSLLCQHANIGILPSKKIYIEEEDLVSTHPAVTRRPSRLRRFIERSIVARRLLLLTAILGMCMLIGDGILTPAISVLSAIDGLRGPFPSVSKRMQLVRSSGYLSWEFGTRSCLIVCLELN